MSNRNGQHAQQAEQAPPPIPEDTRTVFTCAGVLYAVHEEIDDVVSQLEAARLGTGTAEFTTGGRKMVLSSKMCQDWTAAQEVVMQQIVAVKDPAAVEQLNRVR